MIYIKHYTYDKLIAEGYEVSNMYIDDVSLSMADHGCLTLCLSLEGEFGVGYGGYCLSKGYLGAPDDYFEGSAKGMESIIRIMDVIGVDDLIKAKGHYVRVAHKGFGSTVKIIGNIIEDKWFDYGTFFSESTEDTSAENSDKDNADINAKDNTDTDYVSKAKDLYARMQKWADEHNIMKLCDDARYYLNFDEALEWSISIIHETLCPFEIYFCSEKLAAQALKEFKPELNEIFVDGLWKRWIND